MLSNRQSQTVAEKQILKENHLLKYVMVQLIKNLLYEFKNHNYDGNRILRVVYEMISAEKQSQEKKQVLSLWVDIELHMWNLSICPKYWVIMFNHEQFFTTEQECVDMHVFTNKIYRFIEQECFKLTAKAKFLNQIISAQIFLFLEEVSMQICECYEQGRQIILKQTKLVEELVKNSPIINFYLLYKLLLEISNFCQAKLVEQLSSSIFRNIELSYCQLFANYILQKHEIISLVFDNSSVKRGFEEPLIDIMERIKTQKNLKWRQAIREDGQSGIIIEFDGQNEGKNSENYMIKMDNRGKINVMNCNNMRMKWKVTEAAQKNYEIINIVSDKNKLAERLRGSPLKLKQITVTDHISTVGGALGKCLADIRKYDNVGEFMFDISKKSIISGTFNYIATNIPLIGIMFASGGYTYTLYSIFSNKTLNKKKKFQQLGFVTVDVASSLGSGLIGAVIGQSVIPIPFLGAFLGGFVGGFIGELGGKALTNKLQSMRFKDIINKLQIQIKIGGYWQVNKETLEIFGLARQNFYNTIPVQIEQRLGADKFWFAMIAFTMLCFSESKKRAKFIAKRMKQESKIQKSKQNYSLIFQQIKESMNYETSLDLMCIIKYFENNNIEIISCYSQLEQFINNLFSKIN